MKNSKKIFDKIKNSKNLPSLPQVLLKLIKACNNAETSPKELSQITAQDPSISSKVLRMVNSPYVGLAGKVNSLEKAVLYLGSDTVKNIAVSASVLQAFSQVKGSSSFQLSRFWWHSLLCASLARRIAKKIAYTFAEEAFLSGLLHDIGKLVLLVSFKKEYAAVLNESADNSDMLLSGETKLGATHCEVGAWLIQQWNLDSFMADAVLFHHEPTEKILEAFPLVQIVYVANALCQVSSGDSKEGLHIAETVFGFSPSQIEEISFQAKEEVADVARSFDIPIDVPENAEIKKAGTERDANEDLLKEVKDLSLLYGTLENLLKAESRDSILKVIERGLKILFDVKKVFFFLCDPDKDLLVGNLSKGAAHQELLKDLSIPFRTHKSLIAACLSQRAILDSFGSPANDRLTLADSQIIRLLGTDGMVCLPMFAHQQNVGVIVMGVDEAQIRCVSDQLKLLRMFADHAAVCLGVDSMKQDQTRKIQSERMDAFLTMARKIAHEVNNPLGIIKNYLRIFGLKLPEKHPAQDDLKIISEEIDRVGHIIGRLSAFSQAEAKKYEAVDINMLLSDLLKIIKKSILLPSKITEHLSLDENLPKAFSDKNGLTQVFINLIKNAAEAMPDGGNIYIETRHVKTSGAPLIGEGEEAVENAEIVFRDDGSGIPDSLKSRLFEPFASSKGEGHSGLGLSITRNIVKGLNGVITCESDSGIGTTFKIILPISKRKSG